MYQKVYGSVSTEGTRSVCGFDPRGAGGADGRQPMDVSLALSPFLSLKNQ